FMGVVAQLDWLALGYACLTAGGGTGSIPACPAKDEPGKGALMLTPAEKWQAGAILSDFTFPMSQGLDVTFTTYTYGGNKGGTAKIGADGIAFFLTDGTIKEPPSDTGGTGGALGYSCSITNNPADSKPEKGQFKKAEGMAHAYLGLGIDEYGNFLNSGDNSSDGILNTNSDGAPTGHGGNDWSKSKNSSPGESRGKEFQPNRIGMRGAGNITWDWLHSVNADYYTNGLSPCEKFKRLKDVCKNKRYVSNINPSTRKKTYTMIEHVYNAIEGSHRALPEDQPIADISAKKLADATPITYHLTISSAGKMNFDYSYNNGAPQPVLANIDIASINGEPPESFRFGFSAGTGGSYNYHALTCFTASPLRSDSSASANTQEGKRVSTETQFFLASYASDSWWGALVANPIIIDDDDSTLSVGTVANWDAKCVLTGGACSTMGTDA